MYLLDVRHVVVASAEILNTQPYKVTVTDGGVKHDVFVYSPSSLDCLVWRKTAMRLRQKLSNSESWRQEVHVGHARIQIQSMLNDANMAQDSLSHWRSKIMKASKTHFDRDTTGRSAAISCPRAMSLSWGGAELDGPPS